jgi:hypothetical protein
VQVSVFNTCAGEACHQRAPFAAGLDLTAPNAWDSLVGVSSVIDPTFTRVVPGNATKSFAWLKVTNQLVPGQGSPMPRGRIQWQPLPGDALRTMRCWIEQGAPR